MNMLKTAREIGLFETAINIAMVSNGVDIMQKVEAAIPLPPLDIGDRVKQIVKWLLEFDKNKYMFLTPEIALVEAMVGLARMNVEAIIAIPCDMEAETKERLKNNLPREIKVTVLEEPYFPEDFFPRNSMLVVCGYSGGNRPMVLSDTYRMIEHYRDFLGKKVFVPYVEIDTASRYDGWMEINSQRFSEKWRSEL